jgi:hypothetical protein
MALFGVLAFTLALAQMSNRRGAGAFDLCAIQLKPFDLISRLGLEFLETVTMDHEVNPLARRPPF